MKQANATQIDDMPEIPAHQDIDARRACERYVQCVGVRTWANDATRDIRLSQFRGLRTVREHDLMSRGHLDQPRPNGVGSPLQFAQRVRRQDQGVTAFNKMPPKRLTARSKLRILAAADHRRVGVHE